MFLYTWASSYLFLSFCTIFQLHQEIMMLIYFFHSVPAGTSAVHEPKFIVFYSQLLALFSLFCFNCQAKKPVVTMKTRGTMVTVMQSCQKCISGYTWRSQPLVLGSLPAGNILLSFSVLMAGATISNILLVFRHMGLCVYSSRSFFSHQKKFLFPTILHYWDGYRTALLDQLRQMKDTVWCGDGRFDSMGHSAKYGVYTMLSTTILKIVHFELVQVKLNNSLLNAKQNVIIVSYFDKM